MNLPNSAEAERSCLAVCLVSVEALEVVMDRLTANHFYQPAHRLIFEAIHHLWRSSSPVDIVTLTGRLREADTLQRAGGIGAVTSLSDGALSANIDAYIALVIEKAVRRELLLAGQAIAELAAAEDENLQDQTAQAEALLLKATSGMGAMSGPVLFSEGAFRWWGELSETKGQGATGVKSGFSCIDKVTGGFQPGDLIILAARPGLGKTTLALQIALSVAEKKPVQFFSLEMPLPKLAMRYVTALTGIKSSHIYNRALSDFSWEHGFDKINKLFGRRLWLDDTPGMTTFQARARATRAKKEHGLSLVVVDYLNLLRDNKEKGETRNDQVGRMARNMKMLARELEIPVILLAQLNRATDKDGSSEPELHHLRDSGEVEMVADMVMFLSKVGDTEQRRLSVKKNKMFATGEIKGLIWDEERAWFGEQHGTAKQSSFGVPVSTTERVDDLRTLQANGR